MNKFFSKITTWDRPRIFFWVSKILCSILGHKVACCKCGKCLGKVLFVRKKGGYYFCNTFKGHYSFQPQSHFSLEFECLSGCGAEKQYTLEDLNNLPDLNFTVSHLILAHQDWDYIDKYLKHHASLSTYERLLMYGGKKEVFETLPTEYETIAFYADCPTLRGPKGLQSYTRTFIKANELISQEVDWTVFTESDVWGLRSDYFDLPIRVVLAAGADFGTVWLTDVTAANDETARRCLSQGLLDKVCTSTKAPPPRVYHSIGCIFIMKREVLDFFAHVPHDDSDQYMEIYLPTVLCALGFKGVSIDSLAPFVSSIRFEPPLSPEEIRQAKRLGCSIVHPVKNPEAVISSL